MKAKNILLIILAGVLGMTIWSMMAANFQKSMMDKPHPGGGSSNARGTATSPAVVFVPPSSPPIVLEETIVSNREVQVDSWVVKIDQKPKTQNKSPQSKTAAKGKAEIQDPAARVALSFVGMDAEAEAYWYRAINNPDLPAEERKDLIEDLNEDGLSDPHHPAPGDMPLILNRLLLIEQLAPYAMDQVDLDAFKEAHKDLANMLNGLPVQ